MTLLVWEIDREPILIIDMELSLITCPRYWPMLSFSLQYQRVKTEVSFHLLESAGTFKTGFVFKQF